MQNKRMNLRLFEEDVNIMDTTQMNMAVTSSRNRTSRKLRNRQRLISGI